MHADREGSYSKGESLGNGAVASGSLDLEVYLHQTLLHFCRPYKFAGQCISRLVAKPEGDAAVIRCPAENIQMQLRHPRSLPDYVSKVRL